jgi:hypothetical protein
VRHFIAELITRGMSDADPKLLMMSALIQFWTSQKLSRSADLLSYNNMVIDAGREESTWAPVSLYLFTKSVSRIGVGGNRRQSEWVQKSSLSRLNGPCSDRARGLDKLLVLSSRLFSPRIA